MKKIILDTDILNEMDDQFALIYLLGCLEKYKNEYSLEAVTIAPFNPSLYLKIEDKKLAMKLSKKEVEKIFKMCNCNYPIFIGSDKYFGETKNYNNEAVDNIIEIAKNSKEKVVIISIGCATNIAMALKKEPKISDNLEIVWLGGNGLSMPDNSEFNLMQDVEAVNTILDSSAELTIIPARPVSSSIFLSKEVSEKYLMPNGKIGKYLHNLIETFSKNRLGAGRKLWDVACVYEFFNRHFALLKLKTEAFRSPIVYKQIKGVKVDDKLSML